MVMSPDDRSTFPKYTGKNFGLWKRRMQAYLEGAEIWDDVMDIDDIDVETGLRIDGKDILKKMSAAQQKRNKKALAVLTQALPDELYECICDTVLASQAWDILVNIQQDVSAANRTRIMENLLRLRKNYNENYEMYLITGWALLGNNGYQTGYKNKLSFQVNS